MNDIEKVVGTIFAIFIAVIFIYAFAQALFGISVILAIIFVIVAAAYIYREYIG
jgi:hypothetical protein